MLKIGKAGKKVIKTKKRMASQKRTSKGVKMKRKKRRQRILLLTHLGSEECPTDADMEEIEYSMIYRIPKIENLEKCTKLTVSNLFLNFF
jgi:hypothetical protein